MKIALLGVQRRINNILQKMQKQPFEVIPYVYKNAQHLPDILKKITDVDGFLFTGRYPYNIAKKFLDSEFPAEHLEFDETCFGVTLFKMPKIPREISIDTIKINVIKNIYHELNIEIKKIYSTFLGDTVSVENIVDFHIKNLEENKDVVIFTCLFSVFDRLKKRSIPAILLNHTFFSIQRGIENLIKKYYFYNSKSSYPAVGIIKIYNYNELLKKHKNEFNLQKFLLKFHENILNFQEKTAAFLIERNEDTFFFISTRYLIEKYSANYKEFPIINEVFSKYSIKLKIAIGYGLNPQSAFHNAKKTLPLLDETQNNIAISTELGKVITISNFNSFSFETVVTDKTIQNISKQTGIGISNLTKIKAFLLRKQSKKTTVFELSRELNITTRSGGRIINNLLNKGFAEEVGIEQPVKGRPRRIFKINL